MQESYVFHLEFFPDMSLIIDHFSTMGRHKELSNTNSESPQKMLYPNGMKSKQRTRSHSLPSEFLV